MTELVIMKNQQAVTTSLQVAEAFEKSHRHVLEAIDSLKKGVAENWADLFSEETYIHPQNKQAYREIVMNRDGFTLLAMGFTGIKAMKFKLEFIKAFNEMEEQIKQLPVDPRTQLKLMYEFSEQTAQRVDSIESDVKDLKENKCIEPGEYNFLGKRVSKRVYEIAKAYGVTDKSKIKELYRDINTGVLTITGVGTRTQLKEKHYKKVMDFINDWEPSAATKVLIRQGSLFDEKEAREEP